MDQLKVQAKVAQKIITTQRPIAEKTEPATEKNEPAAEKTALATEIGTPAMEKTAPVIAEG
jgi:hypothetical protein